MCVLTQAPLDIQLKVNQFCRKNNIKFITAETRGVFCWCFVDFGEKFEVFDKNGEFPKELFISDISREEKAIITCTERHHLEDGEVVKFLEMTGQMDKLMEGIFPISTEGLLPEQFRINFDTTKFPEHTVTGRVVEQKIVHTYSFKSLEESLQEPEILETDFGKLDRPPQEHLGMLALHQFMKENGGSLPRVWNNEDAQKLVEVAHKINENSKKKVDKIDSNLLQILSYTCRGEFISLTGAIGGHIAQEVIKAVSGKFTPLKQWLYLDATEVIGHGGPEDHLPEGNRYDAQVICIGRTTTEKLKNLKLFMVGAGAIGCEMLKNYSLLGISTGNTGKIYVTDNDVIEKSNLNRQFLFRDKDINTSKSTTAMNAVLKINPEMKIEAYLDKVGPETEDKYSNSFF